MDWQDEGVILGVRPHGETSAIVEIFTHGHGRHAGVVRGGVSRKLSPILQPGSQVAATWRARLEEHIGSFTVEPLQSRAGLLSDRDALAGLNALCALLRFALPEREVHPRLYSQTMAVLEMLEGSDFWPLAYLRWEAALLEELGFGLDLATCAVTGTTEGLCYVSPKSGRAVSAEGAGKWADRLLPLPPELMGAGGGNVRSVLDGLQTTGYFLDTRLAPTLGDKHIPEARRRLLERLRRRSE